MHSDGRGIFREERYYPGAPPHLNTPGTKRKPEGCCKAKPGTAPETHPDDTEDPQKIWPFTRGIENYVSCLYRMRSNPLNKCDGCCCFVPNQPFQVHS